MKDFKFSTLEYKRPDCEKMAAYATETKERIENASSYAEVKEAILAYDEWEKDFSTDTTIATIRHTLDTTDEFYEKEIEYIDTTFPTIMPQLLAVDEALMNSPYRAELENEYGKQFFAGKRASEKGVLRGEYPADAAGGEAVQRV